VSPEMPRRRVRAASLICVPNEISIDALILSPSRARRNFKPFHAAGLGVMTW
jgi:hypothetical protein